MAGSNVTGGQAPLTVVFSSAGSTDNDGGITGYAWDFGDGNSSTSANPTYTYSAEGTYTATLTVSDVEGATDSSSVTIDVDPIPNVPPTVVATAGATTPAGRAADQRSPRPAPTTPTASITVLPVGLR